MIILVKNPSPPKFRKFAIKPPTNPKIIFIMTLLDLPVAKPDWNVNTLVDNFYKDNC